MLKLHTYQGNTFEVSQSFGVLTLRSTKTLTKVYYTSGNSGRCCL